MMARFDRNVPPPRLPLLRPQQVLVVVVLLAGMADQTVANKNLFCFNNAGFESILVDLSDKCSAVPLINAAFDGKLIDCNSAGVINGGSYDDCDTTERNINKHPGYNGPDVQCIAYYPGNDFSKKSLSVLSWGRQADCKKGAKSIQRILDPIIALCNKGTCSNHGTCQANTTLDGHVCTCNTPDLGGGWDGKNCELCNGVQPPTDPAEDCDGITLADCTKSPAFQQACPTTCGMCFTSTTTSTTTTTGLCNGNPDLPDCGTTYNSTDCVHHPDNFVSKQAKLNCPAMCGTCVATTSTTATATSTTDTATTDTATTDTATTTTTVTTTTSTTHSTTIKTTLTTSTSTTTTNTTTTTRTSTTATTSTSTSTTTVASTITIDSSTITHTTNSYTLTRSSTVSASRSTTTLTTTASTTTAIAASTTTTNAIDDGDGDVTKKVLPLGIIVGAAAGTVVLLVAVIVLRLRQKRRHPDNVVIRMQNAVWNPDNAADDDALLDYEHGGEDAGATTASSSADGNAVAETKFVANTIRLGRATQAADGLADLMGFNDMSLLHYIDGHGGGSDAIIHEINKNGTEADKKNLRTLLDGTYTNPPDSKGAPQTPEELAGQSKTIDELMETEEAKIAKLQRAHVLALRLYTTSTYASMNNPLRTDPATKPHPLAATVFYASQGIKKLRAVAGTLPTAHQSQDLWRGMKDMTISDAFFKSGGTEFACMSTSLSREIAIDFANSKAPMIVKLETKDFMSRGADISWLSVYPGEGEILFPPLTFLRPIGREIVVIDGKEYLLVRCGPVIP